MEFEFDKRKSGSNKRKHGIDFIAAQELWDDPDLLEIPAITKDEPRYLVVGRIGKKALVGHYHLPRRPNSNYFSSSVMQGGGCVI